MNAPSPTDARAAKNAPARRLPAEERRELLLDAGQALFGARPYREVSLSEVSARAGVSRALIQHYFGNKRELYRAVFARALDALSEEVHGDTAPLDPEAVEAKMRSYFAFVAAHPAGALVAGQGGGDGAVGEMVDAFIAKTTEMILAQVPDPAPALPAALAAWSQMNIALGLRLIREGDVDADWAARFSARMLLGAVAAA